MVSKVNLGETPANFGIQLLMGISDGVGPMDREGVSVRPGRGGHAS